MRLNKSIATAISALALSTGAAFAGEGPLTDQSDSMGYQPYAYQPYEIGGPEQLSGPYMNSMDESVAQSQEYEVYDVYIVPSDTIVQIPSEEDLAQPPVLGNEQG